ncbi:MAG: hypothetical protein P1P90_01360 [Patescibacteria group bacterium]|nr:hypothetical protein [Patescibacteria group bacterium]
MKMHRTRNGVKKQPFDKNDSYMSRTAGMRDDLILCERIKELLVSAREVFLMSTVTKQEFQLLTTATECTEKVFCGYFCEELLDYYYQLGVILVELGQEDLGVTFQYLHHTYRNRPTRSWPPMKARVNGHAQRLESMIPINKVPFDDLEADTENDILPIPL